MALWAHCTMHAWMRHGEMVSLVTQKYANTVHQVGCTSTFHPFTFCRANPDDGKAACRADSAASGIGSEDETAACSAPCKKHEVQLLSDLTRFGYLARTRTDWSSASYSGIAN